MSWHWGLRSVWPLSSQTRLALRLLRDPQVPLASKALPLVASLYLMSPIDLLPDVLPVLGQVDDVGLIVVATALFLRLCPEEVVAHHRAAIAAGRPFTPMAASDLIIDAHWHRD